MPSLSVLALALAGAAAALPSAPASSSQAPVPNSLYVNGVLKGSSSPKSSSTPSLACSADDDVLQCANRVAKDIQASTNVQLNNGSAPNFPILVQRQIPDHYEVDLAWSSKLFDCSVKPQVVSQGEGYFCNSDSTFKEIEKGGGERERERETKESAGANSC